MRIVQLVVRVIISIVLLCLAYNETGPWTTVILTLIMINNDLLG